MAITYCAKLTEWKKEPEKAFLSEVSSVVLQQSLRNLDTAFTNFFAKRAEYPKFKVETRHRQSAPLRHQRLHHRDGRDHARQAIRAFGYLSGVVRFLTMRKMVNLTVSKDTEERYFVSILVETDFKPLKKVKAEVGIDVGIKTLARTSDGQRLENPRPLLRREKRLKRRQRRLSRKVKGSNNRKKAKLTVAKLHARISDTRRDTVQKFTTKIIRENQAIFVEGLNVAGMLKNGNLAKHIADAAFAEIFRELEYKARWYGRSYIAIGSVLPIVQVVFVAVAIC